MPKELIKEEKVSWSPGTFPLRNNRQVPSDLKPANFGLNPASLMFPPLLCACVCLSDRCHFDLPSLMLQLFSMFSSLAWITLVSSPPANESAHPSRPPCHAETQQCIAMTTKQRQPAEPHQYLQSCAHFDSLQRQIQC